jgi:hypothetical protein
MSAGRLQHQRRPTSYATQSTKAGIYSRQLKSNLGKLYLSPEFCSSLDPYCSHYFGETRKS